jgi:phenylacetate-CoA ligase
VTAYAGTPDYLKTILEKAEEMGIKLNYSKAAVSGGALFPSLRDFYSDRGIECLQCYGTAELGCIAYESNKKTGMIIEEGVIIEIVTPGTGTPVKLGEVGEVLVTTLGSDYPLIRFATGDMSAIMSGQSACGRTNTRIKGWMGRADQTTKIKGMFVRPEQVAELVKRHQEIVKARVVVERDRDQDRMVVKLESLDKMNLGYTESIQNIFRINGDVEVYGEGELPIDGLVIEDLREYE